MTKLIVNNAAGLFLPGAEAVSAHGTEVDADTKNAAVKGWVEAGLLVAPKDFAKPVAPSADPKVQVALDQALADLTERDATIADLTAKIEALTADLAAATKPADPPQT
jgi:hypothetical protein